MQPLAIQVQVAETTEHIRRNVQSALSRGLPEFAPSLVVHDGHLVCVGSGPSMPSFVENIREERRKGRPILAVKGAHDYLCEQNIVPDLWLCIDPKDRAHLLTKANDQTIYLVSSRCDPVMFDALQGRKVTVFHAYSYQEELDEYSGKLLVGGGTTSGLRGITVGYLLGFRKFILYGYDSCLAPDKSTKRFTGEKAGKLVDVIADGKRFWCNGAMAQQANEFQDYYTYMPDLTIDAKGDGLIAAIVNGRRKRGLPA